MKNKSKLLIIIISLVIGIVGFIGTLFICLKKDDPSKIGNEEKVADNIFNTSSKIIFKNVSSEISLGEMIPTLDKFGINNKEFIFTIQNISSEELDYTLKLIDDDSTILNKMIRYELKKDNVSLGIHTLRDDGIIDIDRIGPNKEINYRIVLWLDYQSEVKIGSFKKKIGIIEENDYFDKSGANKPRLLDNLIPVYYDDETLSYYKSDTNNSFYHEWYNYDKKIWANAINVNLDKFAYYKESPVGTRIDMNDINAFWVWIPRFKIDNALKFVSKEENAFKAFTFNGDELDGIWVSKYEAGLKEDDLCYTLSVTSFCNTSDIKLYFKPNLPMLNRITMANLFYAIRKMELKNNIYGFANRGSRLNNNGTIEKDDNNIDIHMIKNSEWESLILLANSVYGNNKILPNKSFITGRAYQDKEMNYNLSDGVMASTTGNITGIYDLVGGRREYVMMNNNLFNKKSNSGFTNSIKEYYYDEMFTVDERKKLETLKNELVLNDSPITRGGYQNINSSLYSVYGPTDYINKISLETNSRAVLCIKGENYG